MNIWNAKTMSIEVERTIQATPAEIFEVWLDPDREGSLFYGVDKAIVQPVVDGFFYRMHRSDKGGHELAHYGRFLAIKAPTMLKHTWVSQHTRGLESLVTMRLEARGDATRVVIRHDNLPDDEKGHMHEGGWSQCLDRLTDALAVHASR
jgi:uncharacterized protein YndB with AHSA1/START domain